MPEFGWQAVRGEHIHFQPQQIVEFEADGPNVHQCGLRHGLHLEIQVAARNVVTPDGRTEYPHAAHAMAERDLTDAGAVQREDFGRTRGLSLLLSIDRDLPIWVRISRRAEERKR